MPSNNPAVDAANASAHCRANAAPPAASAMENLKKIFATSEIAVPDLVAPLLVVFAQKLALDAPSCKVDLDQSSSAAIGYGDATVLTHVEEQAVTSITERSRTIKRSGCGTRMPPARLKAVRWRRRWRA